MPTPLPDTSRSIDELIGKAVERLESETVPCPRCNGVGYHHGFGEGGHDPDWCVNCGGCQYESQDPKLILRELIADALAHLQREAEQVREALKAIQSQCAGHSDEFSLRVWQIADAALHPSPDAPKEAK